MSISDVLPHGTIVVTRELSFPVEEVFRAWTQLDARRQWFAGPEWQEIDRELDLRVGGGEVAHGRFPNGIETYYKSTFYQIRRPHQLIYAFDMKVGGEPHSVSLAGVNFDKIEGGTRIAYVEQAFFLTADYGEEGRLAGTNFLLDRLADYLTASQA